MAEPKLLMPPNSDYCYGCGNIVYLNSHPFCPHEQWGVKPGPFVPYVDHFISQDVSGVLITSHRQRMQVLKANNLDFKDRTGKPGCEV